MTHAHKQPLPEAKNVFFRLSSAELMTHAIDNGEAVASADGALVATTGEHTGRSAKDKFVVRRPQFENDIWWGAVNQPLEAKKFEALRQKMFDHMKGLNLYCVDCYAGSDTRYRLAVRAITEFAWHAQFARNMFICDAPEGEAPVGGFSVINIPSFKADPSIDGTRSETFIALDFERREVLIGGTEYAGETKKAIFTVLNYLLPEYGVLPMHCSANMGDDGDTAVFFGLSGTGKTTLSADASRQLIGDDEHGWSDEGVFNFEGGCYAKAIDLTEEKEPEIYAAGQQPDAILENVVLDDQGHPDYFDVSLTENTRISYPISSIPNAQPDGMGNVPSAIIYLTCDAFGVLPPVSRLTKQQAADYFITGYTAKVAGTEKGITEPTPNFSPCFGGPFLPRAPKFYADMLIKKLETTDANVYLINTGWSGGAYGEGERMSLKYTREIVKAVLNGSIEDQEFITDDIFQLARPLTLPNIPAELLNPRQTWKNTEQYDQQAQQLAESFKANLAQYA